MNVRRKRKGALISLLLLLLVGACRAQNDSPAAPSSSPETVISSTPPFKTKEPDRYRATRTITSITPDGKTTVVKSSTARDGEMRRTETEFESRRMVLLTVPQGTFILFPDDKLYTDNSGESAIGVMEEGEISPDKLLHEEIGTTSYQKLGAEMIGGRNANKYRVVVNNSNTANVSPSETLIWIDEALGMPIKSETKSSDGTHVTMELSDIRLDVDKDLFQVPEGYKKVGSFELLKRFGVLK